eukprot:TRINITY_DN36109_c0_g1_i1.p1 TRINITY_DN36109_c0_g1~~TRINITY_DN36109_c0_g1_i1.p1  ORF type:complete len:507 (+),score=69.68 TRINITY_DN36109_c0_g1_i1:68-1588(+)
MGSWEPQQEANLDVMTSNYPALDSVQMALIVISLVSLKLALPRDSWSIAGIGAHRELFCAALCLVMNALGLLFQGIMYSAGLELQPELKCIVHAQHWKYLTNCLILLGVFFICADKCGRLSTRASAIGLVGTYACWALLNFTQEMSEFSFTLLLPLGLLDMWFRGLLRLSSGKFEGALWSVLEITMSILWAHKQFVFHTSRLPLALTCGAALCILMIHFVSFGLMWSVGSIRLQQQQEKHEMQTQIEQQRWQSEKQDMLKQQIQLLEDKHRAAHDLLERLKVPLMLLRSEISLHCAAVGADFGHPLFSSIRCLEDILESLESEERAGEQHTHGTEEPDQSRSVSQKQDDQRLGAADADGIGQGIAAPEQDFWNRGAAVLEGSKHAFLHLRTKIPNSSLRSIQQHLGGPPPSTNAVSLASEDAPPQRVTQGMAVDWIPSTREFIMGSVDVSTPRKLPSDPSEVLSTSSGRGMAEFLAAHMETEELEEERHVPWGGITDISEDSARVG